MKPLSHLTVRVAWHDSKWNGAVCAQPGLNSFCVALARIRESKTADEDKLANRGFDKLNPAELPPCKAESGFFMSPHGWVREFDHPYRDTLSVPRASIIWLAHAVKDTTKNGSNKWLAVFRSSLTAFTSPRNGT